MRALGFRPDNPWPADRAVQVPLEELVVLDIDERDAGFDEPSGQQASLAEPRSPVAVAQPRIFAVDVEGPADRRPGDHLAGGRLEGIHRPKLAVNVGVAAK